MSRSYSTILLLAVLVVLAACKKKTYTPVADEEDNGNASAFMINTLPDSVYVTLSGHDIATGTLPHIMSVTLAPSDTLKIPRAELKNAYRYQYDWHTADYMFSNWFVVDANGKAVELLFDYYADSSDYNLEINSTQRKELLICMDGDGVSSTWKAVNAYDLSGTSVWAGLDEHDRDHSFVISRFHTSRHIFEDTAGKATSTNLSFNFDISQPRMWLSVAQPADSYILTNNLASIAPLYTTATDTLYYSRFATDTSGKVIYPEPFYQLVRQNVER
ncbi:MAG: hypothetical protein KDC07_10400 [Chitinophagaceae bacterium]|nr:hypothetical protein [Chitinophagaceae bacterium]MCB9047264.1 hypothetical protein [Chitinophagales bacterium]